MGADDRSVQVHACHGRQRQVEVLREVLLGLFEDDPTLEPRDVIVMCPDIEAYAPLVSAAFGLADATVEQAHPGHRLKVRLADRSLRQTNPVLTVVARLLDLADSYASRATHVQPAERVAAALQGRGLLIVTRDPEDVRGRVEAAGLEPVLWDNGSPRPAY